MQESSGNKRRRNGSGISDGEEEDGYSTSSSYAPSAIDVSFNYVAPTEIDFLALKRLIQQLYHTHSTELDLTSLSDHIINLGKDDSSKATIGTVVKVEDDEDGDPFAFVSTVNLSSEEEASGKTLKTYYEKVLSSNPSTSAKSIQSLLRSKDSRIYQIFHERMINLPPQIMPPLYSMLFEEIQLAIKDNQPTHFLFFSRVFSTEAFSDDDEEEEENKGKGKQSNDNGKRSKKSKKSKSSSHKPINQAITKMTSTNPDDQKEVGLFHPEDAILAKFAQHSFTFKFPAIKDSDDSFNAPMFGRIVLIKNDAQTIKKLLEEIKSAFSLEA